MRTSLIEPSLITPELSGQRVHEICNQFDLRNLPADFLANLLLGVATTKGLVSVAMVFGSLYPIATALLAFKFLNERLHKVQYVGIALAVTGVSLISAF